MAKLVLFLPDGTAQHIKLDRERLTIGRRPDNDVFMPQPAVSGEHAAVTTILEDSFLEDLGSTNGTLVNGKAITKHFLRDRDEIDIGREILVYLADESAKIEAPQRRSERPVGDTRQPTPPSGTAGGRGKPRSDVPTLTGQSVDAIQRVVAAEIESSASEETPKTAPRPILAVESRKPAAKIVSEPSIRVVTGTAAGRMLPLREGETVIGRAGVQVVALKRGTDGFRVIPIEGAVAPRINGEPVPPDGQRLAAGDILEVAGSTLQLIPLSDGIA
ncbi:MAG TPA: FHA domain-containing protein [Casimicrobiaceae bacterium]|nr:FHA domain-containing protein [Casimicrobiaceae bacterium]